MKVRIVGTLVLCTGIAVSVGLASAASKANEASKGKHEAHIINPEDLKWAPGPPSLPSGAEAAMLDGDLSKKGSEFTIRLRMPEGYKVPPHFHPKDEHVTVLSGSLYMGIGDKLDESAAQEIKAGGFHAIPQGVHHYAFTKGPVTIQVHGIGAWGITYVNPADDPRKKGAAK
jgi:quercetin dioxygenase-like cupin family protein